jgi:hypothetical protein
MAFPSIRSQATTSITSTTTTPAVNLPATIRAGDTLLGFYRCAIGGAISWPDATWNELVDAAPDGSGDQVTVAWKRAVGTESGTITLTTANGKGAGIVMSIQEAIDPRERAPEFSTVATGTTPNEPDATTCTPTGGAKDYLWISWYSMHGEQTGITAYPTSFTLSQTGIVTSGTSGLPATNCTTATCARQLNAASLDADAWDVTGTLIDWSAYTFVVHPMVPWPYLSFYPPTVDHATGVRHLASGMTPPCAPLPGVLTG